MRILHIIESLEFGGAEKVVVSLANGLADRHAITICCLKRVGELAKELDPRIRVFGMGKREGNDYRMPLRLAKLIREQGCDVVHTHNWNVFLEGGLACWLARRGTLIHTAHGPYGRYPPGWRSRCKLAARHLLERLVARRFSRIAAVSDAIRHYIQDEIGIQCDRLLTVHNGIATEPSTASAGGDAPTQLPDDVVTFITVGRLADIKNHAMMLRAFRALLDTRPEVSRCPVRLVIVGDGPARAAIEQNIAALNLGAHVTLTGFRTDTPALLSKADVFVLTSRYEGISIALLEAMRARLPAVCTRVGGIPETVHDNESGLLVELDDDAALTKALLRMTDAPAERRRMGAAGYACFMREFSLDTMLGRYEQLYRTDRATAS